MATKKKAQATIGTVRCTKSPLNSVLIVNDVGGTVDLPLGTYRVRLLRSVYDYETGVNCTGQLLNPDDIQKARAAGTTGFRPDDYRKYGNEHYKRTLKAADEFDPSRVYFSDWDFTPDANGKAS